MSTSSTASSRKSTLDAMTTGSVSAAMGRSCGERCAGLKGDCHRPEAQQRHVDGRVVDAGDSEDRDAITRLHRVLRQCGRDGVDPVRQLAVGDGVETGEQFRGCPTRRRVGDELDRPLSERRPVGVAVEDGLDDLGQPQLGRFNRRARLSRSGRASANCWSVAYRSEMRRASRASRVSVDIKNPQQIEGSSALRRA